MTNMTDKLLLNAAIRNNNAENISYLFRGQLLEAKTERNELQKEVKELKFQLQQTKNMLRVAVITIVLAIIVSMIPFVKPFLN